VTVSSLVDRALAAAAPALDRGLLVERPPAGEAVFVLADLATSAAALAELVRNAAEASPPGGRVRLQVRPGAGRHAVEVSDEGAGISPEDLPRVFEPFFGTRARGVGLGLSVAREAARRQGGDVRLEPGAHGTRALLELPATEARP
jgi:signal transduction histidine kinase